jgi:hypothetical protein
MPLAEFERFRMEVLSEPSLQQRFIGLESKEEFAARLVESGAERGFEFTASDVEEALRASRSEWVLRWV